MGKVRIAIDRHEVYLEIFLRLDQKLFREMNSDNDEEDEDDDDHDGETEKIGSF